MEVDRIEYLINLIDLQRLWKCPLFKRRLVATFAQAVRATVTDLNSHGRKTMLATTYQPFVGFS